MDVLVARSDGAGFCYLSVKTLIQESGYKSILRAARKAERDGLLIRWTTLRNPEARKDLARHQRQGQGITVYRLGEGLCAKAGLKEVDVSLHLRLIERNSAETQPSVAPGDRKSVV